LRKVGKGWRRLEKVAAPQGDSTFSKRLEKVGNGWERLEKVGKGCGATG
jgi:hypothetical protein